MLTFPSGIHCTCADVSRILTLESVSLSDALDSRLEKRDEEAVDDDFAEAARLREEISKLQAQETNGTQKKQQQLLIGASAGIPTDPIQAKEAKRALSTIDGNRTGRAKCAYRRRYSGSSLEFATKQMGNFHSK